MLLRSYDREDLRKQFQNATPFPHVAIDGFLEEDAARRIAESYPSYGDAKGMGRSFEAVNEQRKVQITDAERFPPPVKELHEALASPAFLEDLAYITGIEELLADPTLAGGGMHVTGARGRLDVHVDFNFLEQLQLHRRLNLLLYLNPRWEKSWGGAVELWDEKVEHCHHRFEPVMNRCVIFETSERSFHGVEPVTCPDDVNRQSFAVYYYTEQAPPGYTGHDHSTVFRARPDERFRKYVLMPGERAASLVRRGRNKASRVKAKLKGVLR